LVSFCQIFVMLETACSSGKALHVVAEDGYHANTDVRYEISGPIVNKLMLRHATVLP